MAQVTLKNISKKYGNNLIIPHLNLAISDKEFISLLGPSGCGKTTTLRMIAGLEKPTEGEIHIGDRTVSQNKFFIPPEKRNLGMVFQSYAVWPHMTVFENVCYPLKLKKVSTEIIHSKVEKFLGLVKLDGLDKRYPHELSGGQQQRVALARALIMEPEVLLLDEPLSNLDAKLRELMRVEIKELQQKLGMTVVYVTHDQVEAMVMSDRIVVMDQGEIEQVDTPTHIYQNPQTEFVANFVGTINFLPLEYMETKNDHVILRMEDQIFSLSKQKISQTLKPEKKLKLGVRPESITLKKIHTLPAEESFYLTGTVEQILYFGDHQEVRVKASSHMVAAHISLKSHEDDQGKELKIGDKVELQFHNFHLF